MIAEQRVDSFSQFGVFFARLKQEFISLTGVLDFHRLAEEFFFLGVV